MIYKFNTKHYFIVFNARPHLFVEWAGGFWDESFGPENWARFHTQNNGNHGEPSTGLIHLRTAAIQSGHCAAPQPTSSADSADSFGGGTAVVGGSGAE